jgi:hypothetical protein
MNWIESAGGPLIFVPFEVAAYWGGVRPNSSGVSDYDRACMIDDELEFVSLGERLALALGDEPFPTMILPRSDGGLLVRWVYANSDEEIIKLAAEADHLAVEETGLCIDVPRSETWLLFDSGEPGDASHDEVAELPLDRGRYHISRMIFAPDADTKFLVYKITKTG